MTIFKVMQDRLRNFIQNNLIQVKTNNDCFKLLVNETYP